MHLTVNEISSLLKTWNAWYLLTHDGYLKSEFSENVVEITITPFDNESIDEVILKDLRDYTDFINLEEEGQFKIKFAFPAWEHQSDEIFRAVRPIIEKAEGASIEIINAMDFIEKDLPEDDEMLEGLEPGIMDEVKKFREEQKALSEGSSSSENKTDQDEESEDEAAEKEVEDSEQVDDESEKDGSDSSEVKLNDDGMPHNELVIRGSIGSEIEIKEVLHNDKELPQIDTFLEASRLYETIERNFEAPKSVGSTTPYECANDDEAQMVSFFLGSSTDFRARIVKGSTINTGAQPEELAAVVSFIRYRNDFSFFNNPHMRKLRFKRKKALGSMRNLLNKSCSCMFWAAAVILGIILWMFYKNRGG